MPLDELASGLLHIVGRLIGHLFIDIILELLIKGPGYLINKAFARKKDIDPDGFLVLLTGIIFWVLIGIIVFFVISYTQGE